MRHAFPALLALSVIVNGAVPGSPPAGSLDWPPRARPGPLPLEGLTGPAPKDLGAFGHCRIVELSSPAGGADAWYLVTTHLLRPNTNEQRVAVVDAGAARFRLPLNRFGASQAMVTPSTATAPKGLMIYLTGIMGLTPPEEQLVRTFQARGWHTLVSAESFADFERRTLTLRRIEAWDQARALAAELDERMADRAYAVEAMLQLLAARHPEMLRGPRVLAGGSAGAIALPAVAARIGGARAQVLIGGAAQAGLVLVTSSLKPVSLRWLAGPGEAHPFTREDLREFGGLIVRHTRLDPGRLAAGLKGRPTLMLHGRLDAIVPAALGDALHELLGRPERWVYPLDHILLFGMLHLNSGAVVNWAEEAVTTR